MKTNYKIIECLREAPFSKYYLATDDDGNKKYIIK